MNRSTFLQPTHLAVAAVLACAVVVEAANKSTRPLAPLSQRFGSAETDEITGFARHVIPLIGKLGCNGRACHGSFQGQNGFRLSLFGHDLKMDHSELTVDEGEGPRVNLAAPEESLILIKPVSELEHEGGKRFDRDGWQYRVLLNWIKAGAEADDTTTATLESFEVTPREIRVTALDKDQTPSPVQLRAIAYFSDGTSENVTELTIFTTNDETIAEVDAGGVVSAVGPGDTAIVATYGGAVVTSQIIVPVKSDGRRPAPYPANNEIDQFVAAKLKKVGIEPSRLCSDEVFLRRVYLDVIGTLPTADETRRFLSDGRVDKRARLIEQLLNRPEYGMYWATKFSDWTGNDNRFTPQPRAKTGWLWHDWLRDKIDRNVPYDEIVGGFITATTREGRSLEAVVEEYTTVRDNLAKGFDDGTYARRRTNTMYWLKAGNNNPETLGLQAAYAFLGVRLECAQCHKHPFDRWTQDDFRGFTAFFSVVSRGTPDDIPKEITQKGSQQTFRYNEIYFEPTDRLARNLKSRPPKLLGGETVPYEEGKDPRHALWEWMRSPEIPYLSQAIANRLWGHYLGRGIVSPVDNFNAANPPSNPQLLDWLARDFVQHGFDLKHLHSRILNSRTYQLSWEPNESNRLDARNFSHAQLRRMPAEVVLDAMNQVTGGSDRYSSSNAPPGTRAINLGPSRLRGGGPEYVLGIFGRPLRTQTCDCERGNETGLAQAMYLLNDTEMNSKISNPRGKLAKLLERFSDDSQMIEELYLSTLSRYPRDDEMNKALAFVADSTSRPAAMQDILWSLLNLREFIFIH